MTNSSRDMVDGSNRPDKGSFIFSLYQIGNKLREAVECRLRMKSTSDSYAESADHHQGQHPQDHQVQELQQETSKLKVVVVNNGSENVPEDDRAQADSYGVLSPIKERLEQVRQDNKACSWENLSIYRIPHYLKHGEDKAYVPQIISLGPYYHGKTHLCQMEWHKCRCLEHILRRTSHDIVLYRDSVKKVERQARDCYEGKILMKSEKFVDMMVLDGCFVIELLLGVIMGFESLGYPANDPVYSLSRSMHMIQGDMFKLENQIPLFLLDQLLGLQFGISDHKGFVAKLALMFFNQLMPKYAPRPNSKVPEILPDNCGLHFLEVFRLSILGLDRGGQTMAKKPCQQKQQRSILCVTDLREAGIRFSVKKTDRFWDIGFKDGTLQIPKLLIHKGTRSLFLNLIAFEQSRFHCRNEITSYIIFMDDLINSPDDVRYLRECKIIKHRLGSDAEVADLFNRLCQGVVFSIEDSYLCALSVKVKEYESRRNRYWRAYLKYKWNAWIAILKHNYFNNPWSIISVIAAFVLLVLTSTQTFYGVYGYYNSGS